jgi:hypothetical protein
VRSVVILNECVEVVAGLHGFIILIVIDFISKLLVAIVNLEVLHGWQDEVAHCRLRARVTHDTHP